MLTHPEHPMTFIFFVEINIASALDFFFVTLSCFPDLQLYIHCILLCSLHFVFSLDVSCFLFLVLAMTLNFDVCGFSFNSYASESFWPYFIMKSNLGNLSLKGPFNVPSYPNSRNWSWKTKVIYIDQKGENLGTMYFKSCSKNPKHLRYQNSIQLFMTN